MVGTLRDNYDVSSNWNATTAFGSTLYKSVPLTWLGQSFTPLTSYQCTSVYLAIMRKAITDHGDLTVSIYEAGINGNPVFLPLVTGTVLSADIPVTGSGDFAWVQAEFDTIITISDGTPKVIIASFSGSSVPYSFSTSNRWVGRLSGSDAYADGYQQISVDTGTSWADWTNTPLNRWDRGFKVYGVDIGVPIPVPPFPPPKPDPPEPPPPWWDPPDPPVPPTPPGPLPPYWATGGGGHQKNLVVSGNNKIYYEPHTANTVPYSA